MAEKREDFLNVDFDRLRTVIIALRAGIQTYGVTFGLTLEEIASYDALMDKIISSHDAAEAARIASKAATEVFHNDLKTGKATMRSIANRFKSHPAYTEAIGDECGIIGTEVHYDPETMKPDIKVTMDVNVPEIGFVKSFSDGVNIYCKRGSETVFSFLARDSSSPYRDERPNLEPGQPELRQYYAVYIFEDEEHGYQSAVEEITVK